jgi:hypothetical protein
MAIRNHMRKEYNFLSDSLKGSNHIGKSRRVCECNNIMDLNEKVCDEVDWINLA